MGQRCGPPGGYEESFVVRHGRRFATLPACRVGELRRVLCRSTALSGTGFRRKQRATVDALKVAVRQLVNFRCSPSDIAKAATSAISEARSVISPPPVF